MVNTRNLENATTSHTNNNRNNNNLSNSNNKNSGKKKKRGGKNKNKRHLSFDDSITESQENALLNFSSSFTSSQSEHGNSELLSMINSLKREIATLNSAFREELSTLESAFHEFKEQKNTEIKELKDKLHNYESDNNSLYAEVQLTDIRKSVQALEESQDQLQQDQVKNILVISGVGLPEGVENEDCKNTVAKTIEQKLRIKLQPNAISDVYRIGKKRNENNAKDKRPIRFKIEEQGLKSKLISTCIKEKPNVFINEFLTPGKRKLLKKALIIRRDHRQLLHSCYYKNGVLHIKKSPNDDPIKIKNDEELNSYLNSTHLNLTALQEVNQS
jgi:ribosomal protein L29